MPRKTRSQTIRLTDFGAEKTERGVDLARYDEHNVRHVVRIDFGNPTNAGWLAQLALQWLEAQRKDVARSIGEVEYALKQAKGGEG